MSDDGEYVKYPTGKIGKGEFCSCCKKFNDRAMACDMMAVVGGEVLLVKRAGPRMKGFWALPGGYLDWEETTEECARREFGEETGLQAGHAELLGVYSRVGRTPDGRQDVSIVYVTNQVSGEMGGDAEVLRLEWFGLDQLPEKIAFDHREMIKDYIKEFQKV